LKNPKVLAEKIIDGLSIDGVEKIEVAGPGFINFYVDRTELSAMLKKAQTDEKWGSNDAYAEKRIMIEYTDPNPFKEFHIGHLMSNAIGESVSRLLQHGGADVLRVNYQGDVGPHVAKAIWGHEHIDATRASEAGVWGLAYAFGAQAYEENETAKAEINSINAKIYDKSDANINALYESGRKASLEHFDELYKKLGTQFQHFFFESETAPIGVALVQQHSEVFDKSDGAIVYKGEKKGLHTRVFITSLGLPTYETKDLGLLKLKSEYTALDVSITVTAAEQADYFKVMLAAAEDVPEVRGIAARTKHVTHGMMRFAEGKMSSRKGNVITGESLLNELIEVAKERAAESRADDHALLAQQIAVGAIKYQILRQASGKDIIFDRERALSLEGDSGPYLQYTHARAHQVVERAKAEGVEPRIDDNAAVSELMRRMHRFPEVAARAAQEMEPHLVATFLIEFTSAFNSWYAAEKILDGTPAAHHKVAIADAARATLKNGLWLLGIPAPEKM
jgi:arginyl-tRNA synthetase